MKMPEEKESQAFKLLRILWDDIVKLPKEEIDDILRGPRDQIESDNGSVLQATYSNRVLFVAAKRGNINFIVELIRRYPDLIWKVNDDNFSIFHIAVKHRHADIYSLLYEIGAMKGMITPLKDKKDNNMLHLVGETVNRKQLENVPGALEMQRELLWFKVHK
ncbi:ankyrin repeat-containing protein [Tanacetum coccineum]